MQKMKKEKCSAGGQKFLSLASTTIAFKLTPNNF